MKFKNSKFFNTLKHVEIVKPFGNFYFFEKFILSEVNEGFHFDWKMIKEVMEEAVAFYGSDVKLGYISNRVNSYSINPQSWNMVKEEYNMIAAGAIVTYSTMTFMNATIEKQFSENSIKRCLSLDEAIDWIVKLKELN
ncbi:hypothetical protein BWZ22_13950 [Seonamhaeicola sp. S2-3]|uniref:hypothetical protein n=1 Tax=Seonamhaeicola sp. S2-3 TaxID=1936081 RepID=UPI0009727B63|nr:hypothetical protein [Seonamhaeicola sp. S2-3]APY12261.1 hypothetical protein BWZ22_13950 [Seonamhaeicola sp. S2-3]